MYFVQGKRTGMYRPHQTLHIVMWPKYASSTQIHYNNKLGNEKNNLYHE